ncbi:MAG: hypothetical protein OEZ37_06320 [Gemmatimonadota bacterium]|nr:hypothetical protein [Gemmatimonadota bacterium]
MKFRALPFAMSLLLAAGACGPAEVVVSLEIDVEDPEAGAMVTRALSDLEVQLLPYDRDAVFDSMSAAFGTPEPAIPQALMDAREEVRQAQERWQDSERRWGTLRDTLQKINDTMGQFSRGEAAYVALYREFADLEAELGRIERQRDAAFAEFTELQRGTIQSSDSVRLLRENWGDDAFAGVGEIFLAKQRASGLMVVVDTTDATGIARIQAKPGSYWVHARYDLPFTELYWNVPVTIQRGEPFELRLNASNAEERTKL